MSALVYRSFVNRNLPIRERACESKAIYLTRGEARQRVRAGRHIDPTMKPYRCRYCSMWHLGHRYQPPSTTSPRSAARPGSTSGRP